MRRSAAFCGVMRWSASGSRTGALVSDAAPSQSGVRVRPTLVVSTVSGRHLILAICFPRERAYLQQFEAERLDPGQHSVPCRPVQEAGEHGVGAMVEGWQV